MLITLLIVNIYIYIYIYISGKMTYGYMLVKKKINERSENQFSNRDFNADASINPMLVIEIDIINIDPLEAGLAGCPHVAN